MAGSKLLETKGMILHRLRNAFKRHAVEGSQATSPLGYNCCGQKTDFKKEEGQGGE